MKINVVKGQEVWKSPDGNVKIYDITLDNGTTLQTKSQKISAGGEFEVESYEKNGRAYVRQLAKEPPQQGKQFKADPASRESIEWQTSLKAAVEVARDFYLTNPFEGDIEDYAKEVDKVAVHFKNIITLKPTSVTTGSVEVSIDLSDDQPPIENYDE